jgi:hypothetical protein
MGSLIDVSEADLVEIYSLAVHHAEGTHLSPEQIRVGRCYANSPAGPHHAVRQVVDEFSGPPGQDLVLYWTIAGGPERVGVCPRAAFALWAREEVSPAAVSESAKTGAAAA